MLAPGMDTGMENYTQYLEWKNWTEEKFLDCPAFEHDQYDELFKLVGPLDGTAACEIGFGNGQLLGYLRARGYTLAGTEMLAPLLERARRHGISAARRIDDFPDAQRFNLIVAIDVLEHIPQHEAAAFLAGLGARLTPGGRILLKFPNGDSPYGLRNQHGDVTHLAVIGGKKMAYYARLAGLDIVRLAGEPVPRHRGFKSKRLKSFVAPFFRAVARKLIGNLLLLPIDRHYFSQNIICVLARGAGEA